MHRTHAKTTRLSRTAIGLTFLFAVPLSGCSGTTAFQGKTALAIVGDPPVVAPPPEQKRVEVTDKAIVINEKVQFEQAKATILPVSYGLLDEVAEVIKKNPQIKKLQVEGHASSEGGAAYNMNLSSRRASAVMRYLVDHGVVKGALVAKGFGVSRPLADNDTEEGREKNRRVEFNILEQDKK